MLSADEIKARFENGDGQIDRNGMFFDPNGEVSLAKRLHYALLEGLSEKDAKRQLQEQGLTEFEAAYTLKQAQAFIKDVLGIQVKDYLKELQSTKTYCYTLLTKKLEQANSTYASAVAADITYKDHDFQTGGDTLVTLSGFTQTETVPEYWLTSDNQALEDWTAEDTIGLYSVIVARNAQLHTALTAYKVRIRAFAEQGNYAELDAAEFNPTVE
ncbi:hypothetical protein pEaSNUABM11_00183 [Erwinia phage pEa_SNUABM_11]|nr:hypothetical protein pEaSNUABM11_00183 [Erwinia phage pEa_SNUABM_11]